MKPAIRVEGVSKKYRLGNAPRGGRTLGENIGHKLRNATRWFDRSANPDTSNDFWALEDVSFEVVPGEVIGLIGRNGAGKSTLLKVLSRIVEPTSGRVEMRGRLGSLLEVGTGFHPELSGRENIYLNGSIIGMKQSEIDRRFDEIVAFAEIEKFLDTPVKRYSSGMYVRLAFAIAAHLQPEILILDEVLAVGDAAFQKKCLGKMKDVAGQGRTVLFVSHDMAAIRRLCTRGIFLSQGRVAKTGTIDEVIEAYMHSEGGTAAAGETIDLTRAPRSGGTGGAKFSQVRFVGPNDGPLLSNAPATFHLRAICGPDATADRFCLNVFDMVGNKLINADTYAIDRPVELRPGSNDVTIAIDSLPLYPGLYRLGFRLWKRPATLLDFSEGACDIEVLPSPGDTQRPAEDGLVRCNYRLTTAAGETA